MMYDKIRLSAVAQIENRSYFYLCSSPVAGHSVNQLQMGNVGDTGRDDAVRVGWCPVRPVAMTAVVSFVFAFSRDHSFRGVIFKNITFYMLLTRVRHFHDCTLVSSIPFVASH